MSGFRIGKMNHMHRFATAAALTLLAVAANAQVSEYPDPLFQSDEALSVSLTAPFTTLIKKRPKEDYLPGVIRYEEADGTPVALDLEIRTRGHFRHKVCDYPPVLLNLKKNQTGGTLFAKQNKLKLVIPCRYSGRYEQIILREYLAYRILNTVTDMSFRVRLLRVTFDNTEKNLKEPEVRYAFLIEHKKRLAERYDMKDLKIERTAVADIQPDRLNLTSVFAFLIGNTDFSPIAGAPNEGCCHNYVLFTKEKTDPILAIPYDFDQSGFVSAPYAAPAEPFKLRSVRQRLYRGRCVNNEYLEGSLQRFGDRRPDIYALINEQEGLSKGTRKKLVSYVDQFYRLINSPSDVKRYIVDKCV
jgi:hypothetical protein